MDKATRWIDAMTEAGHTPIVGDDKDLNIFVRGEGFHNGPGCSACGESWCWHCTDIATVTLDRCSGRSGKVAGE